MSVEFHSTRGPGGSDARTTLGGSKPLHRFIRAQPKTIGIIVLILGASFAIVTISLHVYTGYHILTIIPRGVLVGLLSFISGILFIVAEHKPSKKIVVASLALSILTILGIIWSLLLMVPDFHHRHTFRYYEYYWNDYNSTDTDDKDWYSDTHNMGLGVEIIFTCYSVVAVVIFIVMSVLGAAALRSTGSQAVVVMTAAPNDTPVE